MELPQRFPRWPSSGLSPKYTRSRLPVWLVYIEPCESLSAALKRKRRLKPWSHARKEALITASQKDLPAV
jgi:predicted GIY-YIG superfamily endonuclease